MAKFRAIHVSFWSDPDMMELTPEQKFFYLYLLTNPKVKQCGIYEISHRTIEFETGYNRDTVNKLLEFFEQKGKIVLGKSTNELVIRNFIKYNYTGSPMVAKCILDELSEIKDKDLIQYLYGMDTVSIHYGDNNKNKNKNNNNNNNKKGVPPSKSGNEKPTSKVDYLDNQEFINELKKKYPAVKIEVEIEKMKNWLLSEGKAKKDYRAFAQNWIIKIHESNSPSRPMPAGNGMIQLKGPKR